MNALFTALRQPEYVHVLLNPLPVYGLAMGVLALAVGLALKSRAAIVTALAVVFVSAASAWPVYAFGQSAYELINAAVDRDGAAWLAVHKARAENLIWGFYLLAVLAACALALPRRWPRSNVPLAIATLIVAILMLGAGGWMAYAGGKIRHFEFRYEPAPTDTASPQDDP